MPAVKKPAEKRQRKNKPKLVDSQLVAIQGELSPPPPAPAGIAEHLVFEWAAMWKSDLASTFDRTNHVAPLARLFKLRHMVEQFEAEVMNVGVDEDGNPVGGPMSIGSTGQLTLHPLLKECDTLRSQILALEDRFGLSSLSKMKLGIATGEAHRSLDEMNKRIVGKQSKRVDPRLTQQK